VRRTGKAVKAVVDALRRGLTACGHARAWLDQPHVTIAYPCDRHAGIVFDLLERLGTAANLTTHARLAAVAIGHQADLHSTDADFARFPGLRWTNPLAA
jgi:predicted nucleic acid-binding protein